MHIWIELEMVMNWILILNEWQLFFQFYFHILKILGHIMFAGKHWPV